MLPPRSGDTGPLAGPGNVVELSLRKSLVLPAPARPSVATSCEQLESGFLQLSFCNGRRPGTCVPSLGLSSSRRRPGSILSFSHLQNGPRINARPCTVRGECILHSLQLDLGTSRFEILLHLLGVFLAGTFLDGLRRAFDQILGLLEAQTGDRTHGLDHFDLLLADRCQYDIEFGLLFGGGGATTGGR